MTQPKLATQNDAGERTYTNPLTGRSDYRSVTTVLNLLPNGYANIPPNILERAGRRGDYIHNLFENGTTCDTTNIPPLDIPESAQDQKSACAFITQWRPHFLHQELTVFNDTLGYAGSLDAIADLGGTIGTIIADVKTSRDINPQVQLQLAAYGHAEYALVWKTDRPWDPNDVGYWKQIDIPKVDGYGVIYIRGHQHELVPVHVDQTTFDTFATLCEMDRDFQHILNTGKQAIGRPIPAPAPGHTVFDERLTAIRTRIGHLDDNAKNELRQAMNEAGVNLKTATQHHELDATEKLIKKADRNHGTVPDHWTTDAIDEWETAFRTLPPDLMATLEATATRYHIPNLRGRWVRQHHVTHVQNLLADAQDVQDARYQRIYNHAQTHLDGDVYPQLQAIAAAATAARKTQATNDPALLQQLEAERAIALIEAIGAGVLIIGTDGVTPAPDAAQQLVTRIGSKKELVATGKDVADVQQIDRPRSTADIAADPTLTAAIWQHTA